MKTRSSLPAALGLVLFLGALSLGALTPEEWQYRQSLILEDAGPVRFLLPISTHDLAQPDLRDLRIIDAAGREVPRLLVRPDSRAGLTWKPQDFSARLAGNATILTFSTGTSQPLDSVTVETGAASFLKAARIEVSNNGIDWATLSEGEPVFRQDGASRTRIPLGLHTASVIRVTLNDERTSPIAVTGVTLESGPAAPAGTEPLPSRITGIDDFSGHTVATVDLGAANLPVSHVNFTIDDPLFTRVVTFAIRELREGRIIERTVSQGTLYRISVDGLPPAAGLSVPIGAQVPGRELLVRIANGDSPPLHIREIRAHRTPVCAVIAPKFPGRFDILTGNPDAAAPRYDLDALSAELSRLPLSAARIGPVVSNPAYRRADPLANLALEGAAIDASPWSHRRAVGITTPGVQQIELDLPALAVARTDLADLRLVQGGRQVPYVIERTGLSRDFSAAATPEPVAGRPSLSRWKVRLPAPGLPLDRLSLRSPSPLFSRRIHIFETPDDGTGGTRRRTIASVDWTHTPGAPARVLAVTLPERLLTDTLWIETDNGDNPPITLDGVQVCHPVIRLLCRVTGAEPVELVYGNNNVDAPRYDLGLIAQQLLNAPRHAATLGAANTAAPQRSPLKGLSGGVLFWGVLALVVILLLLVVARLLPKSGKP